MIICDPYSVLHYYLIPAYKRISIRIKKDKNIGLSIRDDIFLRDKEAVFRFGLPSPNLVLIRIKSVILLFRPVGGPKRKMSLDCYLHFWFLFLDSR